MYKLASNFQDFSDVQLFSEHRILQFLYHGLYIMAIFCVYVSNWQILVAWKMSMQM